MSRKSYWLVKASAAALAGAASTGAFASGTPAGTKIDNTASATYDLPNGGSGSVQSNLVSLTVAERLDVATADANGGDIGTTPGATLQVSRYTVTNGGNGPEAIVLAALDTVGGDNFDPNATSIVIDANGNGTYDAGVDTVYVSGSNEPVLAADQSITVFILSAIPAGATDGQRGSVQLTATAKTGSGAPGTIFSGQGEGGTDAVVGSTGASSSSIGTYLVSAATVAFTKSAAVQDSFGGSQALPGATISYTLTATVSGSGTLNNLRISDAVPAGTTYQAGSLRLDGSPLTDAPDADAGELAAGSIAVRLGNVAAGSARSVTFNVKIN